jgi:hypothetical protein
MTTHGRVAYLARGFSGLTSHSVYPSDEFRQVRMRVEKAFLHFLDDAIKELAVRFDMPFHLYNARCVDELAIVEEKDGFLMHTFLLPDAHQMSFPARQQNLVESLRKGRGIGGHGDDERLTVDDREDDSEVLVTGFVAVSAAEIDETDISRIDLHEKLFARKQVGAIEEIAMAQHIFRRGGDALIRKIGFQIVEKGENRPGSFGAGG